MSPKSILPFLLLAMSMWISHAQYTEKINSNRPGTSQGAFSVGTNVLQAEGGFGFGKEKHNLLNTKTNFFNFDYSARYGLLIEQLEIRLDGRLRSDGVRQTIGSSEEKTTRTNFEYNTFGAKYLIFDPYKNPKKDSVNLNSWKAQHRFKWKTLIPAVSAYVGINYVTKNNPFTFPEDKTVSPKVVIMTQNNWTTSRTGDWVLVTNFIIDKVTTEMPFYGWIITSTHTINDKWAVFGEYQGQKSDFYSDNILRVGGAYLWDKNLQLDAHIATNFKDTPSIFNFSFGGSYRFDWHTKDEIIEQPGLEGGVKEEEKVAPEEEIKDKDIDSYEYEENETDSLKQGKLPMINDFEDDDFRQAMEQDLDKRRTEERLERERIESEKQGKKDDKKSRKEERKREKREAKEAKEAEKALIKAEKERQKMIEDIDSELDMMESPQDVDQELELIEKELENLEKEIESEQPSEPLEPEAKPIPEEEIDIDKAYDEMKKQEEKRRKKEEKAKKEEEKRREKEEKMRLKEEQNKQKEEEKQEKTEAQKKEDNGN